MADDNELLRQYVRDRSGPAFAELARRHVALVYQAARRRLNGDAMLAEEVTQEVFATLAGEARSLQRHPQLTGWLYVATRHAANNAARKENRRKVREQEVSRMHETSDSPESSVAWEQVRPQLDAVMDDLSEADRDAVLLRYFENQPYARIGARFRISEDAARMRVDRALEKLRARLGRRGITSTAVALGGLIAAESAVAAPAGLATAVASPALAGAGATGAAGLIAFMTTNKIILGIAGTLALVAGGISVYEYQEVRRTEANLIALGNDVTALRSQLVRKENELLAVGKKRYVAEPQVNASAGSAGGTAATANHEQRPRAAPTGSRAKVPLSSSINGRMDILYASPEYVQLELQQAALELGEQYGWLYHRLGLSAGQIREFESLKLEQSQNMVDTFAAARAKGVSLGDPALKQLSDPAQEAVTTKIKALLGSEGYEAYKVYGSAGAAQARYTVSDLARRLYVTAPVTPKQADQLTEIIAAETPKPQQEPGMFTEMATPDWPRIYVQAKDILSPVQLATLQAAIRSMDITHQKSQLTDRLLQEAAANAAK